MKFGEKIRKLRKEKGISLYKFAYDAGTYLESMKRIEHGISDPLKRARKYAEPLVRRAAAEGKETLEEYVEKATLKDEVYERYVKVYELIKRIIAALDMTEEEFMKDID